MTTTTHPRPYQAVGDFRTLPKCARKGCNQQIDKWPHEFDFEYVGVLPRHYRSVADSRPVGIDPGVSWVVGLEAVGDAPWAVAVSVWKGFDKEWPVDDVRPDRVELPDASGLCTAIAKATRLAEKLNAKIVAA